MTSYPIRCTFCGRDHSREDWHKLRLIGVHYDCLEERRCTCGTSLAVEVDGYQSVSDLHHAVRHFDLELA